jgi:hypothetical protein
MNPCSIEISIKELFMKKVISLLTLAALAVSMNIAVAQDQPQKATVKDKKAGCEATCKKKDKACCPKDKACSKKCKEAKSTKTEKTEKTDAKK